MRFTYLVLFALLLSLNAYADWTTYENDLRNTASSNEVGYFPLKTSNFTSNDLGMDFQPLVADLDNSGDKEIVIFSNNSLVIFSPQLEIKSQTKVGPILGQPTLFSINSTWNIIFNSRQGSDYFFAYKFQNSTLAQNLNISLGKDADFSGIKCLNLSGANSCIFKDKTNYVHVINLDSRTDSSYSAPAYYNESRQTIPAIGDLDNDGAMEAVFWKPSASDANAGNHGIFAFNLASRTINWSVDAVFKAFGGIYTLKGNPVLVDLNNDKKLEVAVSVYYDDSFNNDPRLSKFTELFVYGQDGSLLFSKCEQNTVLNAGCNGQGGENQWEGTNPFVLDYNKDSIDDICFIKDFKNGASFSYMGLNCHNYSGSQIANVKLTELFDGIKDTAVVADINNDGSKEIITSTNVYLINGTSIFDYQLGKFHPIAVDLDGKGGIDLLWSKEWQTRTFLDANNYTLDLSVSDKDINFFKYNSSHINVTVIIKNNGQMQADNVKAIIYNTETLENNSGVFSIIRNGNITFSFLLPLKENEKVLASADYDNEINETDELNNFAFKEFLGLPYVFVSADFGNKNIESEFRNYIKNNLVSGYYVEDENIADVIAYIGKNNEQNRINNINFLNSRNIGYDFGNIIYNDRILSNPFNGLIVSFKENNLLGKNFVKVMIAGNEIEGDISSAKEFINNQNLFLNTKDFDSIAVDDDVDAVKVYDYMHLGGNSEHYNDGSDEFVRIVHNALNDEMFTVSDKIVTANGVDLRLRNLKANFSSELIAYLNSSGVPTDYPVVLARGIHSNLTSWEILGSEFANDGRDAWLIEITGGPSQDCDACPNYNFSDLTDYYWPALINGVLNFTGKEKIQYVGHSNGGRAAIVSLSNGKIDPNKIDTLIGVAVPGAFEGYSTFGEYFGKYGEQIMGDLNGKSHVSMTEVGNLLRNYCRNNIDIACFTLTFGLNGGDKMSFNVDKQYYLWINDTKDTQIGKDLQLNNFYIIEGWIINNPENNKVHDFIVTEQDEKALYGNIISSNKKHYKLFGAHTASWSSISVPDKELTRSIIKDALNKKSLTKYKSNEINST